MARRKKSNMFSSLNSSWDDVKEEVGDNKGGFPTIPTGTYICGELTAELGLSSGGDPQIKRNVTILEGEFKGQKIFDNLTIKTAQNLKYVKMWFNFMDAEVDELEEEVVEEALKEISDSGDSYSIYVKTNEEGFTNMNFKEIIESEETEESEKDNSSDPDEVDLEDMSRDELEAIAKKAGLTARKMKKMDDDSLMDWIEDNEEEESAPEPEPEPETPVKKRRAAKAPAKKNDVEFLAELFKLADAFGIPNITEDSNLEDYKKELCDLTWSKKDLTEDELGLLVKLGAKKLK